MLDNFLENNVQKKLHIFSILHVSHSVSIKNLSQEVKISAAGITALIHDLNLDLQGLAEISKTSTKIDIHVYEDVHFLKFFMQSIKAQIC